jgi:hypothetical protein
MILLSDKVLGRASEPSRTRVDGDGDYETFRGLRLGPLGFSRGCEFIGGRARLVDAQGAHNMGQRSQGWAAPPPVVASLLVSLSPLDSIFVSAK